MSLHDLEAAMTGVRGQESWCVCVLKSTANHSLATASLSGYLVWWHVFPPPRLMCEGGEEKAMGVMDG